MKVRIRSDGTPRGTRVEDEAGERITGIQRVVIDLDVKRSSAIATLTIIGRHEIEADVDAEIAEEPV